MLSKGQTAGDQSTQVLGSNNIVNVFQLGTGREQEAINLLVSVFVSSFPSILEDVKQQATLEVQKMMGEFLSQLAKTYSLEQIGKGLNNSHSLYTLYEAQKSYALTDSEEKKKLIANILTSLISEKIEGGTESTKELALVEAIEVLKKINNKHLSILSLVLYLKHLMYVVRYISEDETNKVIKDIAKLFESSKANQSDKEWLTAVGCTVIFQGQFNLENVFHKNYSCLFQKGISQDQYDQLKDIINIDKFLRYDERRKLHMYVMQNIEDIETESEKFNITAQDKDKIKIIVNQSIMNTQEIKHKLIEIDDRYEEYIKIWNNYLSHANLTPLGKLIATMYSQQTVPNGCVPIDDLFN